MPVCFYILLSFGRLFTCSSRRRFLLVNYWAQDIGGYICSVWNCGICSFYRCEWSGCSNRRRLLAPLLLNVNGSVTFRIDLRHSNYQMEVFRCGDVRLKSGPVVNGWQYQDSYVLCADRSTKFSSTDQLETRGFLFLGLPVPQVLLTMIPMTQVIYSLQYFISSLNDAVLMGGYMTHRILGIPLMSGI
jgi:hypothetical protein